MEKELPGTDYDFASDSCTVLCWNRYRGFTDKRLPKRLPRSTAGRQYRRHQFLWVADVIESIFPHRWTNGIYFAAPVWFGGAEFGAVTVMLLTGILWVGAEIRWQIRDRGIRIQLSIKREK